MTKIIVFLKQFAQLINIFIRRTDIKCLLTHNQKNNLKYISAKSIIYFDQHTRFFFKQN